MPCVENVRIYVTKRNFPGWRCFFLAFWILIGTFPARVNGAETAKGTASSEGKLVPLVLKLPDAAFKGTPPNVDFGNVEPYDPDKPRPPMLVPAGLKNVAAWSKVTSSDTNVPAEQLAKITDGDKDPSDQSIMILRKGTQWVQLDFGKSQELFAIVIWHAHNAVKVYRDVVVQVADDANFKENVRTLFNNDQDNSSNLGVGTDREFFETREGKLINAKGAKARYLRAYSKGSSEGSLKEYTEIEVYGR
jgi:hypothetical protein